MKLNNFYNFITENIRKDEDSYLNDNLFANKKNEARWPDDDDDEYDPYDYEDDSTKNYGYYDDWYDDAPKKSSNPKFDRDYSYDDDLEDEEDQDAKETLHSLLRQMFRNVGIKDTRITSVKNKEILIECHLPQNSPLSLIIGIFEVAQKLKKDILEGYDVEFDVWHSKEKGILMFEFYFDEEEKDDSLPF